MFFLFQEQTLEISPRTSPRVFPPKGSLFSLKNLQKIVPIRPPKSLGFFALKTLNYRLKIDPERRDVVQRRRDVIFAALCHVATSFFTSRRHFCSSLPRRDVIFHVATWLQSSVFFLQLRKTITLSSEVRFGCSWYRWKDLEV